MPPARADLVGRQFLGTAGGGWEASLWSTGRRVALFDPELYPATSFRIVVIGKNSLRAWPENGMNP
jgi:hypothetical protein